MKKDESCEIKLLRQELINWINRHEHGGMIGSLIIVGVIILVWLLALTMHVAYLYGN